MDNHRSPSFVHKLENNDKNPVTCHQIYMTYNGDFDTLPNVQINC